MEKIYDLIIIGGGPGGLSAGIYAGRAQMDVLIIEKGEPGGQIATTSEVVNYPGIKEISGSDLGHKMKSQAYDFGVSFIKGEVIDVDFSQEIKIVKTDEGEFKSLSVIIGTGATPRKLGFSGERDFTGRGVAYCATCDGQFFTGLEVFVIGAGYAAAEEAIFLTKFARKVTIIAREPQFTCAKSIGEKVLNNPKIEVHFNSEILEARGNEKLESARFINNSTGEIWEYNGKNGEAFGIFVFIGYEPQSKLFREKIKLDSQGYILTDENLETSAKDVYAVGDIRPKKLRQVVTAVSDGALAATVLEKIIEEKRERLGLEKKEKEIHNIPKKVEEKNIRNFLDEDIKGQLIEIFKKFENPVEIVSILDPYKEISQDIKKLLTELEELSDKIKVSIFNFGENLQIEEKIKMDEYPTIAFLDKDGKYSGIKFTGLPSGHELNSFIISLYNVAGPGQGVNEDTLSEIQSINKPVKLKIAVSLSCSLCPEVVIGAQRIASLNKNIDAEMIEIFAFPGIREKYKIMSVPALILNDKEISFGKKNIDEIVKFIKDKI
ncbi:thioredoxin reductase (NADPH) [Cetobacterium ceti]|uniref:Thioredoxin reductase (NADPH) n=1 Tax=Cetobacterium ceti TaxID=180163 RepID=A0A1T4LDG8_9FUSO|nr:FAD-dependent oxidoreductase [Cetobacterium ceti]SJZ52765.1 thioredoxin reductase (NADPH) [Cetobacterium ceti]